jgi:hypothetical protein
MDLPAELRDMILQYALQSKDHMVSRDNLPPLPSMRYRYDRLPGLWREQNSNDPGILCKDRNCRHRRSFHQNGYIDGYMPHEHTLKPVFANDYAFGLFLTSSAISHAASMIFFEKTHFIFESRADLHMFLNATGKHAEHVRSITFNWLDDRHDPPSLKMGSHFKAPSFHESRLSTSIRALAEACPKLAYIEMVDTHLNLSTQDEKEFRSKNYQEWGVVEAIGSLKLHGFAYLFDNLDRFSERLRADADSIERMLMLSIVSQSKRINWKREAVELYIKEKLRYHTPESYSAVL